MADRHGLIPGALKSVDAPDEIRARISELCEELDAAAGANLRGLILYGGLARGRYRPGKSDINLVVLLDDTSTESLSAIAPVLRAAWREVRVEPFIIKASEAERLAETFPTKLLDIQTHHIVLMGEDSFSGIDVSRKLIRLRIEQSLTNLVLRLRRRYISIFDNPRSLAMALAEQAVPLKVELAALLQLAGKDEPSESTSAAVLESAAAAFDLDREALLLMAALRRDASPPEDLPALYNRALATIARAAEIVSRME
jgi:predicted nucleotidyltransferase